MQSDQKTLRLPFSDELETQVDQAFAAGVEKISCELPTAQREQLDRLRSLGFRLEGVLKNPPGADGANRDATLLGLQKKEWELARKEEARAWLGRSCEERFTITREQIREFSEVSGDRNPIHLDDQAAKAAALPGVISHGILAASAFSRLLAERLPGPGTIYISQTLQFMKPVFPGAALTVRLEVVSAIGRRLILKTRLLGPDNQCLLEGEAEVLAPKRPLSKAKGP